MRRLAAALLAAIPGAAMAGPCRLAPDLDAELASNYGERVVWEGVTNGPPSVLVKLWVSVERDSWTIVAYTANGMACLVDAGHMVAFPAPPPEVADDPT